MGCAVASAGDAGRGVQGAEARAATVEWRLRYRNGQGREVGTAAGATLDTDGEGAFLEQGADYIPPYDHAADMRLFDFDGDGELEIAFTHESRREHGELSMLRAFRYARGRIAEFP